MKESIFLLDNDGKLLEMSESGYITEDHLQELLANYPNLISGSQINPQQPRKWILICREFGVPDDINNGGRWSLDHLFVDQDGIPTLIEVKRSTDNRIRREVIGQILDYAANAVSYWSIEEIKYRFEERCQSLNINAEHELISLIGEEGTIADFWEKIKTNLKAGKIRMLIVADSIPKEMQRIIEFLNEQMTPAEILGVEIKQFVSNNLRTLVPRVLGLTTAAEITKGKINIQEGSWDEAKLIQDISQRHGEKSVSVVKQIIEWSKDHKASLYYGKGAKDGSLQVFFKEFPSFIIYSYGRIEVQFQHMKRPPFNEEVNRRLLLDKLNEIPGINIPLDKMSKRPSIPIENLSDQIVLEKFLSVFDWYYNQLIPYL